NSADEERWTPPPKPTPSAITQHTHHRLDEKPGERRGQPEDRHLVRTCSQALVDRRHVGELQSPAELNAEETKAHVEQLPERHLRLLHRVLRGRGQNRERGVGPNRRDPTTKLWYARAFVKESPSRALA